MLPCIASPRDSALRTMQDTASPSPFLGSTGATTRVEPSFSCDRVSSISCPQTRMDQLQCPADARGVPQRWRDQTIEYSGVPRQSAPSPAQTCRDRANPHHMDRTQQRQWKFFASISTRGLRDGNAVTVSAIKLGEGLDEKGPAPVPE